MESEEEEGIRKTGEEVEDIYNDAVEEKGNKEEGSKEEEGGKNAKSKRKVIQHAVVTCRRRTRNRAEHTEEVIKKRQR